MLRPSHRPLSFAEALSSVLSGELIPDAYVSEEKAGVLILRRKLSTHGSQLKPSDPPPANFAPSHPSESEKLESFCADALRGGGVLAAVVGKKPMRFSKEIEAGHSGYWTHNLMAGCEKFSNPSTRFEGSCVKYNAVMATSGLASFMPDGRVFGLDSDVVDSLMDAGITVEIKEVETDAIKMGKSAELCLFAASLGAAPAVFAFMRAPTQESVNERRWSANATAGYSKQDDGESKIDAKTCKYMTMISVTQLSTFTLDDMLNFMARATTEPEKRHIEDTVRKSFKMVLEPLCVLADSGVLKLDIVPDTVVFCPRLEETEEGEWEIKGIGYKANDDGYLDGEPKITGFCSDMCVMVPERARCAEAAFVIHALLLVASIHALYGFETKELVLTTLLDYQPFVERLAALRGKQTNLSEFGAFLVKEFNDKDVPASELLSDLKVVIDTSATLTISNREDSSELCELNIFNGVILRSLGACDADTRVFGTRDEDAEARLVEAALSRVFV